MITQPNLTTMLMLSGASAPLPPRRGSLPMLLPPLVKEAVNVLCMQVIDMTT